LSSARKLHFQKVSESYHIPCTSSYFSEKSPSSKNGVTHSYIHTKGTA